MDCGYHENDYEDCNGSGEEQSEWKIKKSSMLCNLKS
jgi:hypothetical protein